MSINEKEVKTKICKICGKDKIVKEMQYNGKVYINKCKVCAYFLRHDDIKIDNNWAIDEYRIIVDNILNDKVDSINNIVDLLNNKTLEDLIQLLKTNLKIGTFNHNIQILKICPVCNNKFYVNLSRDNAICCSKECSYTYKKEKNNMIVKCDNCGTQLTRSKNRIFQHNHSFCNIKCRDTYIKKANEENRNNNIEIRKCKICNKEFECDKNGNQKFCSQTCVNKWKTTIKGENHPAYSKVSCKCDYCGKDIDVTKSKYSNSNNHFCDKECFREWFGNIYSKTDEFKEKSRMTALNNLKNGVFNQTNNSIQRKINELLEEMYIKYRNEEIFDYYSVDNFLLNDNLIIEINGDYFHTSPVFYKEILYENQLNRIYTDKSKKKYIKNKYKINILYLWEDDINTNIELCRQLIKMYISRKGKLKNYNSFNYYINDNEEIQLKKEFYIPYMDYKKDDLENLINLKLKTERQERKRDIDKWITYNCEICGVELSQRKSVYNKNKHHFCSQDCASIFRSTKIKLKCNNCNKEIEVLPSKIKNNKHIFCSKECKLQYKRNNRKDTRIEVICDFCGKKHKQKQSDYKKANKHYCSIECKNNDMTKQTKVNCSNCNVEILRTPSEIKRNINHFCSKECEIKFRSNNIDSEKWILFNCDVCGKEVSELKCDYDKSTNHFCSTTCSGKFRSKSITFKCENCGGDKTMKLSKYNLSKHHFCCYKCSVEYKKNNKNKSEE